MNEPLTLGKRIKIIVKEVGLQQKDFAKTVGVTDVYISTLANDKLVSMSMQLAKIIEIMYGYSTEWILQGTGPKYVSDTRTKVLNIVNKLTEDKLKQVLEFLKVL